MSQVEAAKSLSVKRALRFLGAYAVKIVGHALQEHGIPDILCCWNGRFVALELKIVETEKRKLDYDPMQLQHLKALKAADAVAAGLAWSKATKRWGFDFDLKGHVAQDRWHSDLRDAMKELNQRIR